MNTLKGTEQSCELLWDAPALPVNRLSVSLLRRLCALGKVRSLNGGRTVTTSWWSMTSQGYATS